MAGPAGLAPCGDYPTQLSLQGIPPEQALWLVYMPKRYRVYPHEVERMKLLDVLSSFYNQLPGII